MGQRDSPATHTQQPTHQTATDQPTAINTHPMTDNKQLSTNNNARAPGIRQQPTANRHHTPHNMHPAAPKHLLNSRTITQTNKHPINQNKQRRKQTHTHKTHDQTHNRPTNKQTNTTKPTQTKQAHRTPNKQCAAGISNQPQNAKTNGEATDKERNQNKNNRADTTGATHTTTNNQPTNNTKQQQQQQQQPQQQQQQ